MGKGKRVSLAEMESMSFARGDTDAFEKMAETDVTEDDIYEKVEDSFSEETDIAVGDPVEINIDDDLQSEEIDDDLFQQEEDLIEEKESNDNMPDEDLTTLVESDDEYDEIGEDVDDYDVIDSDDVDDYDLDDDTESEDEFVEDPIVSQENADEQNEDDSEQTQDSDEDNDVTETDEVVDNNTNEEVNEEVEYKDDVEDFVENYIKDKRIRRDNILEEIQDLCIIYDTLFSGKGSIVGGKEYVISDTYDKLELSRNIRNLTYLVTRISEITEPIKENILKAAIVYTVVREVSGKKIEPIVHEEDAYDRSIKKMTESVRKGLDDQMKETREHDKDLDKYIKMKETIIGKEINTRLVVDILEGEATSVFDEPKALRTEFEEGPFYAILKQVMSRDRLVDFNATGISASLRINNVTNYMTIVDFSVGVRLIYIDTDDVDQLGCNPLILSSNVPFAYMDRLSFPTDFKLRMVYRDSCEERPVAVVRRLQKLLAEQYINSKFKVKLFGNYVTGYTTDVRTIDAFESGDMSGAKANSPYVVGRAHTNRIGILVISKKDLGRRRVKNEQDLPLYDFNKNYDVIMVASCRYITDDRILNDTSIPPENRYVRYTITQYDEINSCIIEDGLIACLKAILMEHNEKFGNVHFSVEFELDRASLTPTPIDRAIRDGMLLVPSRTKIVDPFDIQVSKILMKSNRLHDIPFDRGRADKRYFTSPRTIASIFPTSITNNYNIYKPNKEGIKEFMQGRGYLDCKEPHAVTFDVDPFNCGIALSDPQVNQLMKIDVNALSSFDNQEFNKLRMAQARFESESTNNDGISSLLFKTFDILEMLSGVKNE